MLCPFCKTYNVSARDIVGKKRIVQKSNENIVGVTDHYYFPAIKRGRYCERCGMTFETEERATGATWHKKERRQ